MMNYSAADALPHALRDLHYILKVWQDNTCIFSLGYSSTSGVLQKPADVSVSSLKCMYQFGFYSPPHITPKKQQILS